MMGEPFPVFQFSSDMPIQFYINTYAAAASSYPRSTCLRYRYRVIDNPMDSNAPGFLVNSSSLHPVNYQRKEDNGIIDLGLSLSTWQPAAYRPSGHVGSLGGYSDLMAWPQPEDNPEVKNSNTQYSGLVAEDCDEDAEGVQSKERWVYVKVNMDGVVVGRKVCMLDHGEYSSLARQLEDMFGRQAESGLRLFQSGSEFSLVYQDRGENWRTVGDVPWREFVECVKRLRIVRKDESSHPCSSSYN